MSPDTEWLRGGDRSLGEGGEGQESDLGVALGPQPMGCVEQDTVQTALS